MAHTSAESSSSSSNTYMWWLNSGKPAYYKCRRCDKSFKSKNALGGHQNAHRQRHNQMQKFINQQSKKKTYYYQFMPLKDENAGLYRYGRGYQNPLRHPMMPTELDLSLKL
ncbi:hypothetical protein K1719_006594 [Acacia pycnantha]|nr:hypothetical protein K1719_006594 [Acacia pycnantha]